MVLEAIERAGRYYNNNNSYIALYPVKIYKLASVSYYGSKEIINDLFTGLMMWWIDEWIHE